MANGERASAGKAKLCELASVVLLSAPCAAERLRAQVGFELLHAEIGG
jgi:hypothetical protein